MFLISSAFALFASAAFAQVPPAPAGDPAHPDTVIEFGAPEPVSIETDDGVFAISALIADSDPERQRGLMFRSTLADDEGMLFDYEEVQSVSMWMRNTEISLDLIFISDSGEIVKIIANAQPYSLRSLPSDFPVLGVLEVRGSLARDVGIRPGNIVRHAVFDNVIGPEEAVDDMDETNGDFAPENTDDVEDASPEQ
ncbi:MAG: hypothetical protein DHS20C06_13720 [Hyphobacterium sp.]|nr:MAG: hypothetical protein DHS20C06_13720 [Hyphobacterium sp.]